jgi:hypothetical protein
VSGDGSNLRDYCYRPHHSKRFQLTKDICANVRLDWPQIPEILPKEC